MNILAINNTLPVSNITGQKNNQPKRLLMASKPDTFERSNSQHSIVAKNTQISPIARKYSTAISSLKSLNIKAQNAFDKQLQADGWSGKLADKISCLWGSKKRSKLVSEDIQANKADIEHLQNAANEGNFESEFFNIFGVKYDKEAIDNFEKVSDKYTLIQSSTQIADYTESHLRKYTQFFEKHADSINPESPNFNKTKKHPPVAETLANYKQELAKLVGGEENLQKLALSKMPNFITASREEEIEVYNHIAEGLIYTSKATAEKLKEGKKDKQIQKEYDEAFAKAYGKKNNIQKRVTDYVKAQQIRSVALKDIAMSGIIGTTLALSGTTIPAITGAAVTTVGYFGMDIADLATNKIDNSEDMSKDAIKDRIKYSLLYGAEYFVAYSLYDIIPAAESSNKVLNSSLNIARTLGIELSTAFVCEYLETGKWGTDQITPQALIAITLSAFATEELTRMGLSKDSNGIQKPISQADLSPETIKTISHRASIELQKQFEANPAKVMNLKLLNMENPELFNELLINSIGKAA